MECPRYFDLSGIWRNGPAAISLVHGPTVNEFESKKASLSNNLSSEGHSPAFIAACLRLPEGNASDIRKYQQTLVNPLPAAKNRSSLVFLYGVSVPNLHHGPV
jgi:hypothetical protein